MSEDLPPQRDWLTGDAIAYHNAFNPIAVQDVNKDPVIKEIVRLSMAVPSSKRTPKPGETELAIDLPDPFFSKTVAGKRVTFRMDPEQYDRYVILSAGQDDQMKSIFENQTLHEALAGQVKDNYPFAIAAGMDPTKDESRRIVIKSIVDMYRKAARSIIKSELSNEWQGQIQEAVEDRKAAVGIAL